MTRVTLNNILPTFIDHLDTNVSSESLCNIDSDVLHIVETAISSISLDIDMDYHKDDGWNKLPSILGDMLDQLRNELFLTSWEFTSDCISTSDIVDTFITSSAAKKWENEVIKCEPGLRATEIMKQSINYAYDSIGRTALDSIASQIESIDTEELATFVDIDRLNSLPA